MDESKILVIGSSGQLGSALMQRYPKATGVDYRELDITSESALAGYPFGAYSIIINAAAYTNVDGAETDEGRRAAWLINASAPAKLAEIARSHNAVFVHISSDYVFDGTVDAHLETEAFSPLNVYGASKAAGDIAVTGYHKHYLLRTSWVIGSGKNFVRTMHELAQKGVSPAVANDQTGRITFVDTIVAAIDHLLDHHASFGTYNISNSGDVVSWAEIAREVFRIAQADATVSETTTADYFSSKPGVAPRPLKSGLSLDKISSVGFHPEDWRVMLKAYIERGL